MATIQTRNLELSFSLSGPQDAPVLVLSNSIATTRDMWAPQLDALTPDFRVLRYDTRGHGESDIPGGPYSIDQLGQDVLDLMDALDVEKAHFCGLSLGGMTGMWLAAHYPDRIDKLILSNCIPHIGNEAMWNSRIAQVLEKGMGDIAAGQVGRWFRPGFENSDPDVYHASELGIKQMSAQGYAGCCAVLRDADLRASVKEIVAPTLVIGGQYDLATPPEKTELLAAQIPAAKYIELPGGHLSNLDAATAFNAAVLQFLKG